MKYIPERHRVFYFCSRLPSTVQSGLDLRIQSQIKALLSFCDVAVFGLGGSEKPFDFRISLWKASADQQVSREPKGFEDIRTLMTGGSPFQHRFSIETADELRQHLVGFRPDFVIVSRIELSEYVDVIRENFEGELILDLDESIMSTGPSIANITTNKAQIFVMRALIEKVDALEKGVMKQVNQVWLSSQIEADRVAKSLSQSSFSLPQIEVVPNCVSVDKYEPDSSAARVEGLIIYPASFSYQPNLDAAKFLIEELMPRVPELRLMFVGSGIPQWMRENQSAVISCKGPVPDIVPYLHQASAMVVPLWAGGGTRLKVIEALAAGLPVLSTNLGVEGLGLAAGRDYIRAETAKEFTHAFKRLVTNDELATKLSARGLVTAKRNFSTEFLQNKLERLLRL